MYEFRKPAKILEILLAEDNEDDVAMVRDAFREANLVNLLAVVSNGEEALNYIFNRAPYESARRPGLILLDINMPRINGFEVLEELKKSPDHNKIPVVMLTTSDRDEDIARSYQSGACSYITKPVDFDEFNRVIREFSLYWGLVSKIP